MEEKVHIFRKMHARHNGIAFPWWVFLEQTPLSSLSHNGDRSTELDMGSKG